MPAAFYRPCAAASCIEFYSAAIGRTERSVAVGNAYSTASSSAGWSMKAILASAPLTETRRTRSRTERTQREAPRARAVRQSMTESPTSSVSVEIHPGATDQMRPARRDRAFGETDRRRRPPRSEVLRQVQAIENRARRSQRLVRQDARASRGRPDAASSSGMPGYGLVNLKQPTVVERKKSRERVGRLRAARGREDARDERRRAVANHPADRLLGMRLAPALLEQLVRRFGEIAPRIDQRSVQIENNRGGTRPRRPPVLRVRRRRFPHLDAHDRQPLARWRSRRSAARFVRRSDCCRR